MLPAICDFEGAHWLLFSGNVPPLVYYSHFSVLILSLALAVFIYMSNKARLQNKIFAGTLVLFAAWVFLDSIFWATNRSDVIMFAWATIILIEPLIYAGSVYFLYVASHGIDMPLRGKIFIAVLLLPIMLAASTDYTLSGFNLTTCLSEEGFFAVQYIYPLELILTLTAIVIGLGAAKRAKDPADKKRVRLLTVGIFCFLLAFGWGNITGSFTENWQLGQFGLIGMPIAAIFLAYAIVQYQAFQIKVAATNILVAALWILLLSLLFINNLSIMRVIVAVTFFASLPLGVLLVRSVKRVHQQAEELQVANEKLQEEEKFQSELLSVASHQLKGPLANVIGYSQSILDGDTGEVLPDTQKAVHISLTAATGAVSMVDEFLSLGRIKRGAMFYEMQECDTKKIVTQTLFELQLVAEVRGLKLSSKISETDNLKVVADASRLKQVFYILVDNAIKYTPTGSIEVSLSRTQDAIVFSVKDTGVGINDEDKKRLFTKFGRGKESFKTNVASSGLGLYLAKEFVAAHGGDIGVESEGQPGKGSTFYVKIPTNIQPGTIGNKG
ncbi:MAG: HAMP domain-containing sensor histidine kinase [Patescibacteria group bacterium]|mgnify:CR=1 FL=1